MAQVLHVSVVGLNLIGLNLTKGVLKMRTKVQFDKVFYKGLLKDSICTISINFSTRELAEAYIKSLRHAKTNYRVVNVHYISVP
jgi:hypothetical protein